MKEAALEAGAAIMKIYEAGFDVEGKSDGSPVTAADHAANAIILEKLGGALPEIPVVSEEDDASHGSNSSEVFFLVDPLDGTKEFISGNGEFTVNIALIENGTPVLGVVYAPACSRLFYTPDRNSACEEADGSVQRYQGPLCSQRWLELQRWCRARIRMQKMEDLSGGIYDQGPDECWFVFKILPYCSRGSGYLSTLRAHHGMGHCGR